MSGTTRRTAIRSLAVAAGAAAGGWALSGCSGTREATITPTPAQPVMKIPFQLYVVGIPINKTSTALIQQFVDQTFNAGHKGLQAIYQPPYNMQGVVSSVIAGSGAPVVVSSCCEDWPIIQPFLERLNPYLKQDNVDMNTWRPGQLARFSEPDGLYGLPEDAASEAYLYRQDILDELGLEYPDPTWTSAAAALLWQACSGEKNGKRRYGTTMPCDNTYPWGLAAILPGFGGSFMDADRTRCLLDTPGSIRCGEYWMDLVWSKVATVGGGYPNAGVFSGDVVFAQGAEPTIIQAVQQLGFNAKWDFIPFPRFPVAPVGVLHDNFYGMLAEAPDKDVAWELLRFAAVDPDWSRFYMRLSLAPPAQPALLQEWISILRDTAPVLKNKHLEYWTQPTLQGEGHYDYEFFRYAPAQADTLISEAWPRIWNRQIDVAGGFQSLAQQINALQQVAGITEGAAAGLAKEFPSVGPPIAAVQPGL